jgi:hypothetical protein
LILPRPQNEARQNRRWNQNFSFFSFNLLIAPLGWHCELRLPDSKFWGRIFAVRI